MTRWLPGTLSLFLVLPWSAWAHAQQKAPISHETLWLMKRVSNPVPSPDGKWVVFEVKEPSESRGAWDYYKLISTIPANEAFRPVNEGGCALVRS